MNRNSVSDETKYRLLKIVEANPEISQRELAADLGVSLGKVNYCVRYLTQVGLLEVGNFALSKNRGGYIYVLTPAGIKEKEALIVRHLELKLRQYEQLGKEIIQLKNEIKTDAIGSGSINSNHNGN